MTDSTFCNTFINSTSNVDFWFEYYCQISNISHTLVCNELVYHSDVVGASLDDAWRCSNSIFMFDLTPGFNGLGKGNCKTNIKVLEFGAPCIRNFMVLVVILLVQRLEYSGRAMLPHWGRDKMAAIFQTTFSNAFFLMKVYKLRLRFHWRLFAWVQLTIFQHWFR